MVLFLVFACESEEEKLEKQKRSAEFQSKTYKYLSAPDQEIVALLSVKYKIDLDLMENIMDVYLSETDPSYQILKSTLHEIGKGEKQEFEDIVTTEFFKDKSKYADAIKKVSNKFSLDPAVVASIIIDYQAWKAAKELGTVSE
jgi:hypothetical protein